MRTLRALALALALALVFLPSVAAAQSVQVRDPSTGQAVFSTASPAPVKIVSGTTTAAIDQSTPGTSNATAPTCTYNSTPPTLSSGASGPEQCNARNQSDTTLHAPQVTAGSPIGTASTVCLAYETEHAPSICHPLGVFNYVFSGANLEFAYQNWDHPALLSVSAGTTSQTTADQTNFNGKCAIFVLDMTNVGTGSVTLTIEGKDTTSSKYYTILAGAAVTTVSTNVYRVCPGLTAAANATANDMLPRTWRVRTTANNANATTYTVGASLMAN